MTYDRSLDRSLDDLPLAAYGGTEVELAAQDDAGIEAVEPPSEAGDDVEAPPSEDVEPAEAVPPGSFAHAVAEHSLPSDNFGAGAAPAARSLPPAAARVLTTLRTSRPAAAAAFGGVIVVGLLLLVGGGPKPGAAGAEASASTVPLVVAPREPGNATLVLTGEVEEELTFTASTGPGAPGAPIAITWSDPTANVLGLVGSVDRGTRTTAEALVLRWTVVVDEEPITFTSTDGECILGMAVHSTYVSGTFACKKIESDDGKYVVGASGTYRT